MRISEMNIESYLQRTGALSADGVKRESGGNPERCSHCVRELFSCDRADGEYPAGQSLGNREDGKKR